MSQSGVWAVIGILAKTTPKSSGSDAFLLLLLVMFAVVYFAFLRPQSKKARAARQQGLAIEVGDEVQTIGGIIGRVLEIDGERVTIVSGGEAGEGGPLGATPTRLVLVRQAIGRKIDPPAADADEPWGAHEDEHDDGHDDAHDDAHDDEHHDDADVDEGPEPDASTGRGKGQ